MLRVDILVVVSGLVMRCECNCDAWEMSLIVVFLMMGMCFPVFIKLSSIAISVSVREVLFLLSL